MASWLVHSTPDRVVRVHVLAGDIVFLGKTLYSQTQVYKWVPYCSAMLRHNCRKWMALLTDASSNSRRCLLTRELTVYKIVSEALEGKLCLCNLHKLYGVL